MKPVGIDSLRKWGNFILEDGKHKTKSFLEVYKSDPEYEVHPHQEAGRQDVQDHGRPKAKYHGAPGSSMGAMGADSNPTEVLRNTRKLAPAPADGNRDELRQRGVLDEAPNVLGDGECRRREHGTGQQCRTHPTAADADCTFAAGSGPRDRQEVSGAEPPDRPFEEENQALTQEQVLLITESLEEACRQCEEQINALSEGSMNGCRRPRQQKAREADRNQVTWRSA